MTDEIKTKKQETLSLCVICGKKFKKEMKAEDRAIDYLEEKFPKGRDKRRGEALVVNALGYTWGYQKALEDVDEIIKWLKDICFCNAHDIAWIEETIKKLKQLKKKEKQK
jgi:hypothetical protein